MKKIIAMFLVLFLLNVVALAETMQTANSLGQGKMALTGSYYVDSNAFGESFLTYRTFNGSFQYGLLNSLDLIFSSGSVDLSDLLDPGQFNSFISLGLSAKYAIIEESSGAPALAGLVGYRTENMSDNDKGNLLVNQVLAGVIVSKVIDTYNPYASIIFRSTTWPEEIPALTQFDFTLGTAIAWSQHNSLFIEYTLQMISASENNFDWPSSQAGFGLSYKF